MADGTDESSNTPRTRVRVGMLSNASEVRRACARIANAVLTGRIRPQVGNAAVYAVATASRALEVEHLEALQRQLANLQNNGLAALPSYVDAELMETRQ